jgi:hypothetical protein
MINKLMKRFFRVGVHYMNCDFCGRKRHRHELKSLYSEWRKVDSSLVRKVLVCRDQRDCYEHS